ncbi:DUF6153 family protein [Streptomyces sp. NPDC046197]|uniref:DUF6153 family protein n=1 Tax=Streptomyces sp. NPDC046197 TaxID=3154337 RepID=UPI0033EC8313
MTSSVRTGSVAGRARWMLLALAVLAGVLAMHALSPAGMPASGQHTAMMAAPGQHTAMTAAPEGADRHAAPVHRAGDACRHLSDADADGGMSMRHAGGTCAAAGTSTAYAPPALLPLTAVPAEPAAVHPGTTVAGANDDRAPPDLSELQLLRI